MSRQRTKIGERVELRAADGMVIACHIPATMGPYAGQVDFCLVGKNEKVVRVTRYRLAPLVELPAFAIAEDTGVMTSASDERGVFAAYGRADDNGMWWAAVGSDGVTLRHRLGFEGGSRMHWWRTEEEALANCSKRLRELGYRVAKGGKKQ